MRGAFFNNSTPKSVPTIRAASVGGNAFWNLFGQTTVTTKVTKAIANAWTLASPRAAGMARIAPTVPPPGEEAPRKGNTCSSTMITPTPDVNPDITEYGVYAT